MNNPEVILYNLNEVLLYTHYEIFGKRVIEASCHEIVLSSQYKDIQDIHLFDTMFHHVLSVSQSNKETMLVYKETTHQRKINTLLYLCLR